MIRVGAGAGSRRRGYGLLEIAISAFLLAVAMSILAQTVAWLAVERRGADRRQRAIQEAANLMERLVARPWDDLTPESARAITLSPGSAEVLRDGRVDVTIAPGPGDPVARRITIVVRWGDPAGNAAGPVRLVSWVYRRHAESKP